MSYDRRWYRRPPAGTPIGYSDPLHAGLTAFYALGEGTGPVARDAKRRLDLTLTGFGTTNPWGSSATGRGLVSAGGSRGAVAPIPAALRGVWPMTIACAFRPSGSGGGNQRIFGVLPNSTNAQPFDVLSFFIGTGNVIHPAYNAGGTFTSAASYTLTPGLDHVLGFTVTPKSWVFYVNGSPVATGSGTFANPTWASTAEVVAAGHPALTGNPGCAPLYWGGWWSRALGAAEHAAIGRNANAIWGRMYGRRALSASFAYPPASITSVTPSSVFTGRTTAVSVTGFDTTWSGSPFSLVGAPAGTSITGQTVTDASHATVTIQSGSTTGAFTLSDGTLTFPMSVEAIGASVSPATIPADHPGNITLTLTGQGTSWTTGTTFTLPSIAGSGLSLVSKTWNSATSVTLVVHTTGAGTGTGNITDSTDSAAAPLTVAAATLAATPADVGATSTTQITLTGTNTLWTHETASGLFTTGFAGATISGIAVLSDTHATATLSISGEAGGTLTVADASTGSTATIDVRAVPSGSLHIASPLLLQHSGGSTGVFGGQSSAWLAFRFRADSNAGLNLAAGTTILTFAGSLPSAAIPVAYIPATRSLSLVFFGAGGTAFRTTIPVQVGAADHIAVACVGGQWTVYRNGLAYRTGSSGTGTFAYGALQFGGNAGNTYGTSDPQAMDHRLSDVAAGNGPVPTAAEFLALAKGDIIPLNLATPARAWWPLGGGTVGVAPVDAALTDTWGFLADWTGNGNTLAVATPPAGQTFALANATYGAPLALESPLLISAQIDKTGHFAAFEAAGATPINGVNPPATISAVGADPTIKRAGTAVSTRRIWFPSTGDSPLVLYELRCGGVRGLAVEDGGEGHVSPVVTAPGGATFGTPVLKTGVTSYGVTNTTGVYRLPPILTIADAGGSGTGAKGYCLIDPGGRCTGVVIPDGDGGTGYVAPVGIISGGTTGSGATVELHQVGGVVQDDAVMTAFGSGYPPPPAVTVPSPPNTKGPAGNVAAQARAIVYGSDAADFGGTPGQVRAVVPLVGGTPGCGTGYAGTTLAGIAIAAPPSGAAPTIVGNVSQYIAAVPVTAPGDYTGPPDITVTDAGATRVATLRPMMVGAAPSDVFTYDAPAEWLTATLGGSINPSTGAWTQGNPVGGLQAVTGASIANSAGQTEAKAGGLLGFDETPTMLAGANAGAQPSGQFLVNVGNQVAKNKLHAYRPNVLRGTGTLLLAADESPVSWTAGCTIGWKLYVGGNANDVDGMGDPAPYGVWTACYDDPNVNTDRAAAVQMSTTNDAANLTITPVMLSGPASPIPIPAANITVAGGAVTAISLSGLSLGTGWQGAGVVIGGGQGGATASVVVSGGVPVSARVVTGGSGYTAGSVTAVLYGTRVSGTEVVHQHDYQYVPTTTPGTGPTEWATSLTFEVAHPDHVWTLSNPWLVAPDVRTRGGTTVPFDRANPYAIDDGFLAVLTTPTGRTLGALRPMDAVGNYGGLTNYIHPGDLPDGSRLNWFTIRSKIVNFPFARALNTDPASSTYSWSSTKVYAPQAWAVQDPDAPFNITGTLTEGSTLVANVSDMGLMVGSAVAGDGIPAGATIAAVNRTFTANATTGSPTLAVHGGTDGLAAGMAVAGQFLPAGSTIKTVDGPNQITLAPGSQAAGALATGYIWATATGDAANGSGRFTLSAPATASGVKTLAITSPGTIGLAPSDMGNFLYASSGFGAIEVRSTVPHGLSTGYVPNMFGTTAVPIVGGSTWTPTQTAGNWNLIPIWVTGPYTLAFFTSGANATGQPAGHIQAVDSTTELATDWQLRANSPPSLSCTNYEFEAAKCRRLGCEAWFNIPQGATDDCIRAIAARVAANAGPTIPIHLEYGNELFTFPSMRNHFGSLGNLIGSLPAGTSVLGGTPETLDNLAKNVTIGFQAFQLASGAALDVFEAAWVAAGMDATRLRRHVSGQFGNSSFALAGLQVAQRTGRRVDHTHGAPYVFLPIDAPVTQAVAPAGSVYAAAGSLPADAINALNLYYISYSQLYWTKWAAEATVRQAFGQPIEPLGLPTYTAGTGLPAGNYTFYYTFTDQAGGYGVGNETTIGLSASPVFAFNSGNIPNLAMPAWPPWAQALNWYAGNLAAPGVCTFYQQVTRADYESTYQAGSPYPLTIAIPGTHRPPPSTNGAASHTPAVPTQTCYEGSLQDPVSAIVPCYTDLLHDTFLHPSAADLFRGFHLFQQRGNPTVPGSGVVLACYFEETNPTQYPTMWFLQKGTSQMPGDGLGHAYAGSQTYTVAPNRFATIQGGYSPDGVAPDAHDHFEFPVSSSPVQYATATSPMLKALRDWSDVASPAPGGSGLPPATPTITWGTPAPITYGTALSATQLDATASADGSPVAGVFTYAPASGAILPAGTATLSTTFTPADTTTYTTATASVLLVVNRATPAISWPTPTPITLGTGLTSGQLDATAGIPGTFVYSPPFGTVLPLGTSTLSTTFTPADTANYTTATASVTIQVIQSPTPTPTATEYAFTDPDAARVAPPPLGAVIAQAYSDPDAARIISPT